MNTYNFIYFGLLYVIYVFIPSSLTDFFWVNLLLLTTEKIYLVIFKVQQGETKEGFNKSCDCSLPTVDSFKHFISFFILKIN